MRRSAGETNARLESCFSIMARIMGHDEQPACSPCSVPTGTGLVTATASKLLWLVWEMESRSTGEYGRRIHIASSAGASEVILGPRSTLVSCHVSTMHTH